LCTKAHDVEAHLSSRKDCIIHSHFTIRFWILFNNIVSSKKLWIINLVLVEENLNLYEMGFFLWVQHHEGTAISILTSPILFNNVFETMFFKSLNIFMFLYCFDVLISKIFFLNEKIIILIYFQTKNILKTIITILTYTLMVDKTWIITWIL
jgi:hypothetical protein